MKDKCKESHRRSAYSSGISSQYNDMVSTKTQKISHRPTAHQDMWHATILTKATVEINLDTLEDLITWWGSQECFTSLNNIFKILRVLLFIKRKYITWQMAQYKKEKEKKKQEVHAKMIQEQWAMFV